MDGAVRQLEAVEAEQLVPQALDAEVPGSAQVKDGHAVIGKEN
jgi:hypothetical protein